MEELHLTYREIMGLPYKVILEYSDILIARIKVKKYG